METYYEQLCDFKIEKTMFDLIESAVMSMAKYLPSEAIKDVMMNVYLFRIKRIARTFARLVISDCIEFDAAVKCLKNSICQETQENEKNIDIIKI